MAVLMVAFQFAAQEALAACATVKIEINQEVTLERQAFDAHMRIKNDLEGISLESVDVDVVFTDREGNTVTATSNPDNTNALFYIAVDSMSGISDVNGSGTVAPATAADIHWLIIPAQSAGGTNVDGVLYFVGAKLSYTMGATPYVTEVMPDYIYVKPLPDLALDYFLPSQVYGDDAITEDDEPMIPFSLGLRVLNIGAGTAYYLKVDTAQPKIVDNANGLLVAFDINSCEVNGVEASSSSLLADLGTIAPGKASAARWQMTCSLSGAFTEFTASVSHSDELGGQLTSLIQQANLHAHLLIHDVLVDLPGRDSVRDYLAENGLVYESEGVDSSVSFVDPGNAQLVDSGAKQDLILSAPSSGFIYVELPVASNQVLTSVARSDGKQIHADNFWLSKERKANPEEGWDYYLNLFDVNISDCYYLLNRNDGGTNNHSPVLAVMAAVNGVAGRPLGVNVSATDEDGTLPALSAGSLPSGAQFTDGGYGIGFFSWTPSSGQTGFHEVVFTASDGVNADTETLQITVVDAFAGPSPAWWAQRNVMQAGAGTNDYAAAVGGQLKHVAAMAWQEVNALPGGAGFAFSPAVSNNYTAINLGQVKNTAKLFYDRLYIQYPWAGASRTNDYAIANIGQLKNVFSFDPARDTDGDGMPDWWESHYYLNPNSAADATADPDGDYLINRDEYIGNTDPHIPNQ